jgi:hypothetical protein
MPVLTRKGLPQLQNSVKGIVQPQKRGGQEWYQSIGIAFLQGRGPQGGDGNKKRTFLQIRNGTPTVVTAKVAAVGVSSQGL